ncbi:hypothetical protein NQZ68_030092 [Dissostichus eleginoides]|nr:hypothetical protein NQZ68_030092 [Dissostichus eleginoides]
MLRLVSVLEDDRAHCLSQRTHVALMELRAETDVRHPRMKVKAAPPHGHPHGASSNELLLGISPAFSYHISEVSEQLSRRADSRPPGPFSLRRDKDRKKDTGTRSEVKTLRILPSPPESHDSSVPLLSDKETFSLNHLKSTKMPAKTPMYLKTTTPKKGKRLRLRDVLSGDMISPPLGDVRHSAHVGPEGEGDMFGDVGFLQGKMGMLSGLSGGPDGRSHSVEQRLDYSPDPTATPTTASTTSTPPAAC